MINLNPFVNLVTSILSIYSFLLLAYIILYYLLMFKIVNPYSQIVVRLNSFLSKIIEPILSKIRKYIPPIAGIDISMIIVFLIINFIKNALYTYVYV